MGIDPKAKIPQGKLRRHVERPPFQIDAHFAANLPGPGDNPIIPVQAHFIAQPPMQISHRPTSRESLRRGRRNVLSIISRMSNFLEQITHHLKLPTRPHWSQIVNTVLPTGGQIEKMDLFETEWLHGTQPYYETVGPTSIPKLPVRISDLIIFAGLPATMVRSGTSAITTDPAPTIQ